MPAVNGDVSVTGKTPAGFSESFTLEAQWTIQKVVEVLEKKFTAEGKLAAGDYDLVIVEEDGKTVPLAAAQKVSDYPIDEGEVLALVAAGPQKDG